MGKFLEYFKRIPFVVQIAAGAAAGMILGILLPGAEYVSFFGEVFTGALKAVAPVVVLVPVVSSLSCAARGVGKRFRTVIILYVSSTLLSALTAAAVSCICRVTIPLDASAQQDVTTESAGAVSLLLSNMVMNPIQALASANYIGILAWSVVFGLALRTVAGEKTKEFLNDISNAVSKAVSWVIRLAPFGIMGLVFDSVSRYGVNVFTRYGRLLGVLAGCMLIVAFVMEPLVAAAVMKRNPYPLVMKCFRESGITAFFTRSSAANIPVNMALCERLGLEREYYSVSVPLGATVNMNGAAVTITVMSLAAAFSSGVRVNAFSLAALGLAATVGSCGASGVSGGSLLLIPMACSVIGVGREAAMQAVSAGFIVGVVQDSFETALNSSGDVIFCAAAEFGEWQKNGKKPPV